MASCCSPPVRRRSGSRSLAAVEGVTTRGGLTLGCDLVLLGVGVRPNTQFLHGSGIDCEADGIRPDIVAGVSIGAISSAIIAGNPDHAAQQLQAFWRELGTLSPELADHVLVSASLPPAFPWTTVEGRHFWDGGIVSNSPLEQVIERCGSAGKRVYIVDLYPGKAQAPLQITRIVRESLPGDPAASGYDFSDKSLTQLIEAGYRMAIRALDGSPAAVGSER